MLGLVGCARLNKALFTKKKLFTPESSKSSPVSQERPAKGVSHENNSCSHFPVSLMV